MRRIAAALALLLLVGRTAEAQALCDALGTKPKLVAELFFGRDIGARGHVGDKDWENFVREVMGPAFPGFTALDASGQSLDPSTGKVGREPTKYVIVALHDTPASMATVKRVIDAYLNRFHQRAVGVLYDRRCGAF